MGNQVCTDVTNLIPHSKLVLNVEKKQWFAQIDSGHALLLLVKDGAVLVIIRCPLQLVPIRMERSWLAVWIVVKDVIMLAPQQLLKLRILLLMLMTRYLVLQRALRMV
jgi:hypothetical protein